MSKEKAIYMRDLMEVQIAIFDNGSAIQGNRKESINQSIKYLLSAHCVPGTGQNSLQLSHLVLTITLGGSCSYCPHFRVEETEAD